MSWPVDPRVYVRLRQSYRYDEENAVYIDAWTEWEKMCNTPSEYNDGVYQMPSHTGGMFILEIINGEAFYRHYPWYAHEHENFIVETKKLNE